jgi:hypothetical protein
MGRLRQTLANWPGFDSSDMKMRKRLATKINRGLKRSERITSKWLTGTQLEKPAG